jgi:hypothetical protein
MKNRIFIFLLITLPGSAQIASVPQANAKLIEATQVRIESLFKYHDKPATLPTEKSNPFRPEDGLAGYTSNLPPGATGAEQTANRDATLLKQAVADIKISGVVNMGDQMQIAANGLIYKEGSIILVHVVTETVFVRVMKITAKRATFRLGESVITVRF